MPARLSSMELSSPSEPDVDPSARPSRRKSGRVAKQPERLATSSSAKRKRGDDAEDTDGVGASADEDGASDSDDGEPDEEELREKKRNAKRGTASKTAPKRTKTNAGASVATKLPLRPVKSKAKTSRPRKVAQLKDTAAEDVGGLYGEND